MKVTGIQHHSVVVTDLDRARAFYRDVLGLEEVPTPPTFAATIAWFAVGEEQIHLLGADRADADSGRHIALHVEDLAAARQRIEERGLPLSPAGGIPGAERFFTADPDGNRIELICWRRPWGETVRELGLKVKTGSL